MFTMAKVFAGIIGEKAKTTKFLKLQQKPIELICPDVKRLLDNKVKISQFYRRKNWKYCVTNFMPGRSS